MRVLIAYASVHGSTEGVAERIAARLREQGFSVDCAPSRDVPAVAGYDAVVVGSAIIDQAWLPEAARFLSTHADELVRRPVWLYSVGMPGALPRSVRRMAMREGPRVVAGFVPTIRPRDTRIFTGVVSMRRFPLVVRVLLRLTGVRDGDYRRWPDIDAWATGISDCLHRETPAGRG